MIPDSLKYLGITLSYCGMELSQITRSNIRPLNLNWAAFTEEDAVYDEIVKCY